MAKRFTDTDKWKDEWFLELETAIKMLWIYMVDTCDHAGVWRVNFKLASFSVGTILDKQSALKALGDRVTVLSEEKWHIKKFVVYQYGNPLKISNNAHKGVIKLLEFHNIETSPYLAPCEPLETKVFDSLGDKEQEQEQDKAQEQGKEKGKDKNKSALNALQKPDNVISLWNSKAPSLGLPYAENFLTSKNVQDFQEISKCLELAKKTWEEYFEKMFKSEFLTKKKTGGALSFSWALNPDNFSKVMNGAFDEKEISDEEAMSWLYHNRSF
jgi:hypothetical protein